MPLYLTQNEQERCVMARISRQRHRYQANFTLARYGTWEKANRAARKWVRETLPTLPAPISSKGLKTSRNTSGVVGVRLANATRTKGGRAYPDWRWVAFWNECPQSGGIGWSVNKYGDDAAFVCACLARQSESIDRTEIEKKYARLVGTKRHATLLAQKRISPPPLKPEVKKAAVKKTAVTKPAPKPASKAAAQSKAAKPAGKARAATTKTSNAVSKSAATPARRRNTTTRKAA